MEAKLIDVGNSKGIIIPSKLRKLIGLGERVFIDVKENSIIISRPQKVAREGWDEMIGKEILKNGQPKQLMPEFFNDEDLSEWTW